MNILLVYAHPMSSSFNGALKEDLAATVNKTEHGLRISDLYQQKFKAVADWNDFNNADQLPNQYGPSQKIAFNEHLFKEDIIEAQENLLWCDIVIFQFPLWWFGMPAILKGWFDRVLAAGFAYDKGKWFDTSPLWGRKSMLSLTTQAPFSSYHINGLNGPIEAILHPIHHSLQFVGLAPITPFVSYGVMNDDIGQRQQYLKDFEERILKLNETPTLPMLKISDYNESLIKIY